MKVQLDNELVYVSFEYRNDGALTVCVIRDEDKDVMSLGWAKRHPKDTDNRPLARRIALEGAVFTFPREDRRKIWKQYFQETRDFKIVRVPVHRRLLNRPLIISEA